MTPELTKTDTVALWYAVDAYASMVKVMKDRHQPIAPDVAAKERQALAIAKRALRKVSAIRRTQSSRSHRKLQVLQVLQVKHKTARGAGA